MAWTNRALEALYGRGVAEPFTVLLTISHASISPSIRVALNDELEDLWSGGNKYTAFPFEIVLPNDDDSSPVLTIGIVNVDKRISQTLLPLYSAVDVRADICLTNDPENINKTYDGFKLRNVEWNVLTLSGQLQRRTGCRRTRACFWPFREIYRWPSRCI